MASSEPQASVIGTNVIYVSITLPTNTGSASNLGTLIAAGTDGATGATLTNAQYMRIMGVAVRGSTVGFAYGGGAASAPISVAVGTDRSEPAQNFHQDTYIKSASGSSTAYAVCVLK